MGAGLASLSTSGISFAEPFEGGLQTKKLSDGYAIDSFFMGPISLEPLVQTHYTHKKKPAQCAGFLVCGERGIRTPGPVTVNGFQDRRIRPLCHLSAAKVRFEKQQPKKK